MKLAKIKSEVLDTALKNPKRFSSLRMYTEHVKKTSDGLFICEVCEHTTELRLLLEDYCFNEPESEDLFNFAKELIGKSEIDMKMVNVVEL